MIFVPYLEKTLYEEFLNRVRVAYTILNSVEKRKQQLGFYGHTKKLIVYVFLNDKTVLDNFFLSNKNFIKKKYFDLIKLFHAEYLSMAYQKKLESTSFSTLV